MILEPIPFDLECLLHKFSGAGVKYKKAIAIDTGILLCFHKPFLWGERYDIGIAFNALIYTVDDNDEMLGDSNYNNGWQ